MIDTNIILDVLLESEPFYKKSKEVIDLYEKKKIHGFISAINASILFYLIRESH